MRDYCLPEMILYKHYYPFGALMPGRSGGTSDTRYGFQGQEKDDEIYGEGNAYAFEYRMHDPRLGRFWSIDPLNRKYPFYSPYAFSGNRVIDAIELEGLEPWITNESQIVFGPYSAEYIDANKYKPLSDVVTSEDLANNLQYAYPLSPSLQGLAQEARLYDLDYVAQKTSGTYTDSKETEEGETTNVWINIDKDEGTYTGTVGKMAFEFKNAANSWNSEFTSLKFRATIGDIDEEGYIKGMIKLEIEAQVAEARVMRELGRTPSIDLDALDSDYENQLNKLIDADYNSGTRETESGTKSTKEVYGEQYKNAKGG